MTLSPSPAAPVILSARGLVRTYRVNGTGLFARSRFLTAVDGVDLDVRHGETLAVVGESGCGKSTLGNLLIGLTAASAGAVIFDGAAVGARRTAAWRTLRKRLQVIEQDATGALDPRIPVFAQVMEPLRIHRVGNAAERTARAAQMMRAVGLGEHLWRAIPVELSGGQQQRVVIARAAVLRPDLIVCDEPVSALDVSIQAQVIALLRRLQAEMRLTLVFISHDLAVVRQVADRIAVMYLGRIVEEGAAADLFEEPRHPYTAALLSAVPVPDPTRRTPPILVRGEPASPIDAPTGCRFHPRCPHARARCRDDAPPLRQLGRRSVACHFAEALGDDVDAGIGPAAPRRAAA